MARKTAPKPNQVRLAIVAAATELFLEHGYAGVSIRQINAAARVSNGSTYHEFQGGKAAIAAEVYGGIVAQLVEIIRTAGGGAGEGKAKDDLVAALITRIAGWASQHPRHLRFFLGLQLIGDGGPIADAVRAGAIEIRTALRTRLVAAVPTHAISRLPSALLTEVVLGPTLRAMEQIDRVIADGGAVATIVPRLADAASCGLRGVEKGARNRRAQQRDRVRVEIHTRVQKQRATP